MEYNLLHVCLEWVFYVDKYGIPYLQDYWVWRVISNVQISFVFNGTSYIGGVGKNKKEAEQLAAYIVIFMALTYLCHMNNYKVVLITHIWIRWCVYLCTYVLVAN